MKPNEFKGKTALIVGGTSGMGKATAQLLSSLGANVIVASKRKESVAETVTSLLTNTGDNFVKGLIVDLAEPVSVERFIDDLRGEGKIDYLVNASGIFRPKPFLNTTPEEYLALLNINQGFYFITQAVAKIMKNNGGGAIVNIGSYWADNVVKGMPTSAYSMAKSGLHSFTKHLAVELAPDQIRVNAIAPGLIETNVLNDVVGLDKVEETYNSFTGLNPTGRNGKAEEAASAIKYLLSEESSWVTGVILSVDGGMATGRG
ncbi:SDR family NAD(P)-dependent oxidoreductase [Mucilaginibacter sp. SG564]|uniref:SDR family NAD(P)-dependent oxidoreductase n=1 Tax=Mucilaginibacter sp. SG564 TaxID=2587022 RepID=UPI001552230E|nr:SDR family oxidoreductase [Mucilaginibacter sp. SG564]NOW96060.1 NAD(P)-dependent dehydrogenase (short-subunit alcohol dehydrogenase family) [Mucilaginibacter sp. SG564]